MRNTNFVNQFEEYAYGEDETGEWIEGALAFDARLISAAPELAGIAEDLFPMILKSIEDDNWIKKSDTLASKPRLKSTLKTVLFNLYIAYLMNVPVRYSRCRNHYVRHRRYGQLYFKYQRIVATVRALRSLELIHKKSGFRNRGNDHRRQSRMWASGKLVAMFKSATHGLPLQVFQADLEEPVVLKNSKKKAIGYADSAGTMSMRYNLNRYNEFITGQHVKVACDGNREIGLHSLCHKMWVSFLKGKATIVDFKLFNNNSSGNTDIVDSDSSNILYKYNDSNNKYSSVSITQTFFESKVDEYLGDLIIDPVQEKTDGHPNHLSVLSRSIQSKLLANNKQQNALKEDVVLRDFNISQFDFIINSKKLHRVFNKESFELGGRFYGAFYQTMPKGFRKDILIGGEPTVELDYAAHHIRMPYHLEGIDYREDPYLALTDDPEERSIFKKLLLIALNAETEKMAVRGFRDACISAAKKMKIALTNKNIYGLLERVRAKHPGIAGYINSGAGRSLQYLDSRITEAILMRMTDKGIPCLPVHDSYIVPRQFENELRAAMVDEYQALLKFEPVIG